MDDITVAIAAARAGAQIVRARFGTDLERTAKSASDFATDVDVDAERAVTAVLRTERPDDAVHGEELGATAGAGDRIWLVDPLCGTLNFAAASPAFSVNVALVSATRILAAAVADPMADELHWTDGTTAATRDSAGRDRRLAPSTASRLIDVDLDSPDPDERGYSPTRFLAGETFGVLRPRVLSTTITLAWVAVGRRAGYVTAGRIHRSVHFTAGIGLCRAAGCVVTDLYGQPLGPDTHGLLAAADAETHAVLLQGVAAATAR